MLGKDEAADREGARLCCRGEVAFGVVAAVKHERACASVRIQVLDPGHQAAQHMGKDPHVRHMAGVREVDQGEGARGGDGHRERDLALFMPSGLVVPGSWQTGRILLAQVGEEVGGIDEDGGQIDRVVGEQAPPHSLLDGKDCFVAPECVGVVLGPIAQGAFR